MTESPNNGEQEIPPNILRVSFAALLIPVIATLALPDRVGSLSAILWLLALAPAFPFALYRGWRGVATSTGIGTAVLVGTLVVSLLIGRSAPPLLGWIVLAYLAIAAGIGKVAHSLHRQHADVQDLALTDNLTRLPNRRHARVFLENEFGAAERGHPLSVALFDLDGFKAFNDLHGHRAGDRALTRFGEILASTTRRMNLSSRFGGEEFLSILSGSEEAGAVAFAERVRESLESIRLSEGSLTVSAGIAAYHPSIGSPDELIAAADLALYRAKADGRNCVRVFGRPQDETDEDTSNGSAPDRAELGSRETVPAEEGDEKGEGEQSPSNAGPVDTSADGGSGLEAARSIMTALEARDAYKEGHGSCVAEYADVIARAAGLIPSTINPDSLRLACELHDIGEVAIPEEVLNKKGPLAREEFLQVQQHPMIGHRILEPLLTDEEILAAAKWHHERWDGSGYPEGLTADAIPPVARVVAISDALTAMTSPRAYRASLSWQTAVEQISGLGGSQFDPALIDRFRMALSELEDLATRLANGS